MARRIFLVILIGLVVAALAIVWRASRAKTLPAAALGVHRPDPANGRMMFFAGGCASCHATPGADDHLRLGGGLALKSPFGTFHVPNISPHDSDGIGGWTEAQFATAMLKGTSPGGEHYYPSFPFTSYARMTVGDVRDLFAFMKTLPPAAGRVRTHELEFPFSLRPLLGLWKLMFFDAATFVPDPAQSAAWNRGAYLVNGPGHCGECHTPRNRLGGPVGAQRFAGGPAPDGEGWVPNITQFALKGWSAEELADFLQYGDKPDGSPIVGAMVPVVRNTAQLPAADRQAMALYLKSLPPLEGPRRPQRASQ
ncbi:MAG: Nicotinate dehydrogenase subunit B [Pseudorhodoplanes sp.]|nr:Nicotinate dehydrogenase subunit B [Pseudorhodoplanes sp.]